MHKDLKMKSFFYTIFIITTIVELAFAQDGISLQKMADGRRWKSEPTPQVVQAMIDNIWQHRKQYFFDQLHSGLEAHNQQILYTTQGLTNNLLIWASQKQNNQILDDLAAIYLIPYSYLQSTNQYQVYIDGHYYAVPLDAPAKMWLTGDGHEAILSVSQFIYLLSKTINIFLDIDPADRTQNMNDLLAFYPRVILEDHLWRWIFSNQGVFQVNGWACNKGLFNHYEFIEKRLNREFGTDHDFSYCNSVTDTDMWILASVVEMLVAHEKDPNIVPLEDDKKQQFLDYVQLGNDLLQSRLTESQLLDFNNNPVSGLNFDLGAWDDHPDYAYTGYSGETFPQANDTARAKNVGWDISHARRFVHVFESLHENRKAVGQTFPDDEVMTKLSNQVAYGTFNRDFEKPLFTNFMDGTNGWYRVNYSGRIGFAYAPYDQSISLITGGYCFWSKYNPDLKRLRNALWAMIFSQDPGIIQHRQSHYGVLYIGYERTAPLTFNTSYSFKLLNFLPTFLDESTDVVARSVTAPHFTLYPAYPNPFNSTVNIQYDLERTGSVRLSIYDVDGREAKVLVNKSQNSGRHQISWDAHGLASGIYILQLQLEARVQNRKILLLK